MELSNILSGVLNMPMGFLALFTFLFLLFVLLLYDINIGLVLLIFSIPLSPEITGIFGSEIPIRIDDILIIMLFFVWMMKVGRGETSLYRTPFTVPIVAFFVIMITSTIIGYAYKGILSAPFYSLLVILKNLEYYAIFFLAANNIHSEQEIRRSLKLWMAAFFLVIIYGIAEHILFSPSRLYEKWFLYSSQSNHMGGYLMISTTISIALFLTERRVRLKMVYLFLIILSLYPFFYNQSKESYLSTSAAIFVLFLFLRRRLLFVPIAAVLIFFFVIPYLFPHSPVTESIEITKRDTFKVGVSGREDFSSADIRRAGIALALQKLPEYPVIGRGSGYRGLAWYDSQIPLLLYEYGMVGTGVFIWLLLRLFTNGGRIFLESKNPFFKAVTSAFMASFFGILIQSIPSPAWMITLIIEPFWFFAGIITAIDRINNEEAQYAP